jgi:hypothetical protein
MGLHRGSRSEEGRSDLRLAGYVVALSQAHRASTPGSIWTAAAMSRHAAVSGHILFAIAPVRAVADHRMSAVPGRPYRPFEPK